MRYDILFNTISSVSLSGAARANWGRTRVSFFHNRGLEAGVPDGGNLILGGGSDLMGNRMTLDAEFAFNLEDGALQSQRYLFGYSTQCCGFRTEFLERDYGGLVAPAREFRFSVTLQGVGTLFDLSSRF